MIFWGQNQATLQENWYSFGGKWHFLCEKHHSHSREQLTSEVQQECQEMCCQPHKRKENSWSSSSSHVWAREENIYILLSLRPFDPRPPPLYQAFFFKRKFTKDVMGVLIYVRIEAPSKITRNAVLPLKHEPCKTISEKSKALSWKSHPPPFQGTFHPYREKLTSQAVVGGQEQSTMRNILHHNNSNWQKKWIIDTSRVMEEEEAKGDRGRMNGGKAVSKTDADVSVFVLWEGILGA